MITTLQFIIGFGLLFLVGIKLIKLLLPNSSFLEQITLGFICTTGIFTFIWFLINWLNIPYDLISGLSILIVMSVLLIKIKTSASFDFEYYKNLSLVEKVILGIILFLFLSAVIQTVYWPIRYWDSMVLYDFRARVFASSGVMTGAIESGNFFGYPLLTSLMHTWIYLLGIKNPLFYYSLLYILFVVNMFENFKKFKLGRLTTLFLAFMITVSPRLFDHTQWGYTNLPYTIYLTLGSIYLYWGVKNKSLGQFVVSSILIGLSAWTRSAEPFWLTYLIMAVGLSILIKKWYWTILYTGVVLLFMIPWRYFQSLFESASVDVAAQVVSTSTEVFRNTASSVIPSVAKFVFLNVIVAYLPFIILFVLIILLKIYHKSKNWIFEMVIIANLALTFAGTLIFAKNTTYWQEIPDSLSRMVMFLPVIIILSLGQYLHETKSLKS